MKHTTDEPQAEGPATFSKDIAGLEDCVPPDVIELRDDDSLELRIVPVVKTLGADRVRMLSYNGSIPGPTLRVRQGSQLNVHVRNDGDTEATVHWHGLRLDNKYDGVPYETQSPIPMGGDFTYRLRFPDPGLYWYHPHIREDYGLDMGLYGNIVVAPSDPDYWSPVHREVVVTLDDVLIEEGQIVAFNQAGPTHIAMGRFGNVMLTAGEADLELVADVGEIVRFYFTNTANTRLFNVAVTGGRMKLVGSDSGRYEHETFVEQVLLAPSERAIVDVLFEAPGSFALEHRTPDHTYRLGTVVVRDEPAVQSLNAEFEHLRTSDELTAERARLAEDLARAPDKRLAFKSLMPLLYGETTPAATSYVCPMHPEVTSAAPGTCPKCGMQFVPAPPAATSYVCPMHPEVTSAAPGTCPKCGMKFVPAPPTATSYVCPMHPEVTSAAPGTCPKCGMKFVPAPEGGSAAVDVEVHDIAAHHGQAHEHEHDAPDGLEWEDLMPEINAASDAHNMIWKLVDLDTGKENWHIEWAFRVGDRVKIRLVNDMDQDHPMHHPFHIHGAGRFLVLARDGEPEGNLAWKDTVLVRSGETVDILLDVSNPGLWMAHCHIAEHNQSGMMFSFPVHESD